MDVSFRRSGWAASVLLGALLAGCPGTDGVVPDAGPEEVDTRVLLGIPEHLPLPTWPEGNAPTAERIELGRYLFYDTRLSLNGEQSCGSCHEQALAFTDAKAQPIGSTGEVHPRSAMALTNVAYAGTLTWASPVVRTLEAQALLPIFGEEPIVELGFAGEEDTLLARFSDDEDLARFDAAYPQTDRTGVTLKEITDALATFQRSLISFDAPYDRYIYGGEDDAMSESAKRGLALFNGERLECFHCHGGAFFSDTVTHDNTVIDESAFHNNGLYDLDGAGTYPPGGTGLFESTGLPTDMGRFKAPMLRNIAVTAPYMHDGSLETLDDVIDHYARGGTWTMEGPNQGDGQFNRNKSGFVSGFVLTDDERADLMAFLNALTDETFLTDPRHADPFAE